MKMLFFSSDDSEVQQVSREFIHAGIPCEIRSGHLPSDRPAEAELWIQNDRDCHRALMLCVQLGIGFARRPVETIDLDDVGPDIQADRLEKEHLIRGAA
jgi:hypothetical protein